MSHKSTHICVVDQDRLVVWRGVADTHPEMIADMLQAWKNEVALVGLETGSLTPWLYRSLKRLGLPVVAMDARRAADAVKARPEKTDKADARALAEMLTTGWYHQVHVKSEESHRMKALLAARDGLVRVRRQLYGQIRGLLKPFGIKVQARAGSKRFDETVRASCNTDDVLYAGIAALLDALAAIEGQLGALDRQVRQITQRSRVCWHLMSVPGIGPITALSFMATVEDPQRFKRNRDIGAYLGLTPGRYQSGEKDITGGISRQGDAMTRHHLYEAANCLLTTVSGCSALKSWGLKLMKRVGAKKARTAVARKLAVVLLRLWKEESHFEALAA